MIVDPHYWSWTSELPASLCEQIIEHGLSLPEKQAEAGGDINIEKRKSRVSWVDSGHWISGLVSHYTFMANRQAWDFDIHGDNGIQFTKYAVGEFYDPHVDTFKLEDNMRKLSIVIQLSDPEDYEGGEFVFVDGDEETIPTNFDKRGSILVFPSFLMHQVKPVTSGTRHSIVSWFVGPKFM